MQIAPVEQRADVDDDDSAPALVEDLRRKDSAAATRLFKSYSKMVERTISFMVGRDPDLPDLVHDTFLVAINSIAQLREPHALGPWLRGIATWTAQAYLRRRSRRRLLGSQHWALVVDANCYESRTALGDVIDSIDEVLANMPEADRRLFILREIERRTVPEIAAGLGVSTRTASRMVARANARFVAAASRYPALACRLKRNRRLHRLKLKLERVRGDTGFGRAA